MATNHVYARYSPVTRVAIVKLAEAVKDVSDNGYLKTPMSLAQIVLRLASSKAKIVETSRRYENGHTWVYQKALVVLSVNGLKHRIVLDSERRVSYTSRVIREDYEGDFSFNDDDDEIYEWRDFPESGTSRVWNPIELEFKRHNMPPVFFDWKEFEDGLRIPIRRDLSSN